MNTSKSQKNWIISADDFGLNEPTNRYTIELAKEGKIQRVAVLVDGFFLPEELEALKKTGVKLDIHLDMPTEIKLRKGALRRSLAFLIKNIFGHLSTSKMEVDWTRQIEKFKLLFGRFPDGLNSHQHIHFFPRYFKLALKLAKKYDISYFRFGEKSFQNGHQVSWILNLLRQKNRRDFLKSHLKSSEYLVSLDWINKVSFLDQFGNGTVEIVAHPEKEREKIRKFF